MGKQLKYVGETIPHQLIKGNIYNVELETDEFVWLNPEKGGIIRADWTDVEAIFTGGVGTGLSSWVGINGKGLQFGKLKQPPTATDEEIDAAISTNEIYRRVRAQLNSPQRTQVGYGIGKYPEPLNADTWTIIESIGHIKGELMDALHYLTMLEIKFEKMGEKDLPK